MIGITLLMVGIISAYTGFTGRGPDMIEALRGNAAKGYPKIAYTRFILGVIVTALPLLAIKEDRQKDAYIVLMLLSLAMYNYQGLTRFGDYVSGLQ